MTKMNNMMYNEPPNWRDICKTYLKNDDKVIKGFFYDYRWLSNFQKAPVWFEGQLYPSVEHAYQSAKVPQEHRFAFTVCSAAESKQEWKKYTLLDKSAQEWDARKYQVMAQLVFDKFLNHLDLRQKLLDTGDRYLEETNHWGDVYWGVDIKRGGENNLGKILMKTRDYWK